MKTEVNLADVLIDNIKALRRHRQMSQEQLAKAMEGAQTMVARIETGTSTPTLKTLQRLADALDVEPFELLQPGRFAD